MSLKLNTNNLYEKMGESCTARAAVMPVDKGIEEAVTNAYNAFSQGFADVQEKFKKGSEKSMECMQKGASNYLKELWNEYDTLSKTKIEFNKKEAFAAAHNNCNGIPQKETETILDGGKKAVDNFPNGLDTAKTFLEKNPTNYTKSKITVQSTACAIKGVNSYVENLYKKYEDLQRRLKEYSPGAIPTTSILEPIIKDTCDLTKEPTPTPSIEPTPTPSIEPTFFQKAIDVFSKKEVLIGIGVGVVALVALVAYRYIQAQKAKIASKPIEEKPKISVFSNTINLKSNIRQKKKLGAKKSWFKR
jgi:hypothetical protein